jgi:hypothetical protein
MPRTILGTSTAVALVLVLLAASAAHALPTRPAPAAPEAAGLFAPLWSWLSGLLMPGAGSGLRTAWAKAGSDVNSTPTDAGSQMDPDGLVSTPPGDEGSQMDPDGLVGASPGDEGSQMDPNG